MTKTITNLADASPAELEAEYQRLSYEVAQGNTAAGALLAKVEDRIEANERAERRRLAAAAEASRLESEAAAKAADDEHAAKLAAHAQAFEDKHRAYALVQDVTEELVAAVKVALEAGDELRASNIRLGYSAGRTASNEITDYIAWRLGRDGADCAGLGDMPPVYPVNRQPLVKE